MNCVTRFEIHSPEPSEVIPFYEQVFGWEIERWEGPAEYYLVGIGEEYGTDGIGGGILKSKSGESRTINTVQVDSIDECLERVVKYDGLVVVPKTVVPGVGWAAYVTDPDGTLINLFHFDRSAK